MFCRKRDAVAAELERLRSTWVNPRVLAAADAERVLGKAIEREYNLQDLLRRPQVSYASLATLPGFGAEPAPDEVAEQVEIQVKYQGYIERQAEENARRDQIEHIALPADLDYASVPGISKEVQQKLGQHRPETLGQASRLSGMTPAAVSLLLVYLKRAGNDARKTSHDA
jgi:tRNA uridine 5-carboxymethylaminomethyl modification enzyme